MRHTHMPEIALWQYLLRDTVNGAKKAMKGAKPKPVQRPGETTDCYWARVRNWKNSEADKLVSYNLIFSEDPHFRRRFQLMCDLACVEGFQPEYIRRKVLEAYPNARRPQTLAQSDLDALMDEDA